MGEANAVADRTLVSARSRRFRLSDAMILIAGAALALAAGSHLLFLWADMFGRLCREAVAHRADLPAHWPVFWGATRDPLRNTLWYGLQIAETSLFVMVPIFFSLRLRRPRPHLRDLLRQPGAVAGLAMVFGLLWGTGALLWLLPGEVDSMTSAPAAVGAAVAVAWIVLGLGRWWESDPGWIDRLGRLLGWAAIGAALLGLVVFRI